MLLSLTPLLDLLLSLVCLYYGMRLLLGGHDLAGVGYLMVCTAAFTGFFDLGGVHDFRWIHEYLTAVSRLCGILAVALGLIALVMGQRSQRIGAYILAVFGPVASYYFYIIYRAPLEGLYLWSSSIFLLAVIALAVRLWQAAKVKYATLTILGLTLLAAAGLFSHSLPQDMFLKPVDIFHISMMLSYAAIYHGVNTYAKEQAVN
jgi:hypothetical protein